MDRKKNEFIRALVKYIGLKTNSFLKLHWNESKGITSFHQQGKKGEYDWWCLIILEAEKQKAEWKFYKAHKTYTSIYKSNPGGKLLMDVTGSGFSKYSCSHLEHWQVLLTSSPKKSLISPASSSVFVWYLEEVHGKGLWAGRFRLHCVWSS